MYYTDKWEIRFLRISRGIFLSIIWSKIKPKTAKLSQYIPTIYPAHAFGLSFSYPDGVNSEITGLNLKDQELQNALAALDTRVTNAINGGDLAPKVTIDLLNAPY